MTELNEIRSGSTPSKCSNAFRQWLPFSKALSKVLWVILLATWPISSKQPAMGQGEAANKVLSVMVSLRNCSSCMALVTSNAQGQLCRRFMQLLKLVTSGWRVGVRKEAAKSSIARGHAHVAAR